MNYVELFNIYYIDYVHSYRTRVNIIIFQIKVVGTNYVN